MAEPQCVCSLPSHVLHELRSHLFTPYGLCLLVYCAVVSSCHQRGMIRQGKKCHQQAYQTQSPRELHANQHLPCHQFSIALPALLVLSTISFTAPNDNLKLILTLYYYLGMSDTDIASSIMDHFDSACYGLRYHPVL